MSAATPITIAIATCNRAYSLVCTLETLSRIERGGRDCEILVIANCCTDDTVNAASEFKGVRVVSEERAGLSHARNRALVEAKFDTVAFLDDDVNVDRDWLRAMGDAFDRNSPAAVGGRAFLEYPQARPSWLGDRDEGYLTKVELGPLSRIAQPDELYGVNLCVDRKLAQRVGGFRTDLGRIGSALIGSEETDLLERMHRTGVKLWYEPAALVGHRVDLDRLKRRWFWRRCFDGHRGEARRMPVDQINLRQIARQLVHLARATARTSFAIVRHGPRSQQALHESLSVASKLGASLGIVGRMLQMRSHHESIRTSEVFLATESQ